MPDETLYSPSQDIQQFTLSTSTATDGGLALPQADLDKLHEDLDQKLLLLTEESGSSSTSTDYTGVAALFLLGVVSILLFTVILRVSKSRIK